MGRMKDEVCLDPAPPVYVLDLPYTAPPLNLNSKTHWRVKAKLTRELRANVALLCKVNKVPAVERVHVVLVYTPRDSRRRDRDNLVATLKPCLDGIVDAGVVPDDNPAFLSWEPPVIEPASKRPGLRLEIHVTA